jgi:hypothetical protein
MKITARVLNAIMIRHRLRFVRPDGQYCSPYSPLSNWEWVAPAILKVLVSPMTARQVATAAGLSAARTAAALQYGVRQGVLCETFERREKGSGLKVLYNVKPKIDPEATAPEVKP